MKILSCLHYLVASSAPSKLVYHDFGSVFLQIDSTKLKKLKLRQKGDFLVYSAISKLKMMNLAQSHHDLNTNL